MNIIKKAIGRLGCLLGLHDWETIEFWTYHEMRPIRWHRKGRQKNRIVKTNSVYNAELTCSRCGKSYKWKGR